MKLKNNQHWAYLIIILLGLGSFLHISSISGDDELDFEIAKNLDIYYSLYKELNTYYVDPIEPDKLIKKSIDAMLESLDPYTVYIPESRIEDYKMMTTGEYGGIGALIRQGEDGYVIITEPYEGFPAHKAGLRAGDAILKVEGKSAKGLSTSQVSDLLKGQPGTEVELLISRPGEDQDMDITLTRENIHMSSVPYHGMLDNKTGYIKFTRFTRGCSGEVKEAILALKDLGATSLILDMRNNPGGLLDEAISVTNLFVDKGQEVVSTRGKQSKWDKVYRASQDPLDKEMPVVVVVNSSSASASEIVSGALQDLDRGVVIGQRTFGKGLVQSTRELSYNSMLKVTTAKYYIPSGRCIQAFDYSHRNEDGSVGKVPDSLVSEFETRNGRKVYDGGGITPDIETEKQNYNILISHLYKENIIFDFATQFVLNNPTIAKAEEFRINDQVYQDFVEFAGQRDFEYQTKTEAKLAELIETAKEEKYYKLSEAEIKALEESLSHELEKDLGLFREDIEKLLRDEIVSRYYFQDGRIKASLVDDEDILKAIEVLNNPEEYNRLLIPHEENEENE